MRPATPEDKDSVYEFYNINNDPNVLPRPAEDFRRSADNGLFFIGEERNRTVAVAGVFDLEDPSYLELGGTLVDKSLRGFGLQNLLFRIRIASVVVNYSLGMMTAIDPKNTSSAANAMKSGFSVWSNPVAAVFLPCVTCFKLSQARSSGRQCCCDFYLLPDDKVVSAVDQLLKETSSSVIRYHSKRTPDILEVSLRSRLITDDRQKLSDYVSGVRW